MKAAEIRERYLAFFEERGHLRMPSASLIPSVYDPSVLLTTAGMQPFRPYFRGEEEPPSKRLTSCQKSFRTVDIEVVGTTKRHLTFFEMLGNFSVGDYFKQGAAEYAWELSTQGFGFEPERIWITVFGGDDDLGLGAAEDRPGDDTDRFLEYWNLVFMQYELRADESFADLPFKNIDTGLGL